MLLFILFKETGSPCNRSHDKYNQDQYKGANQNFFYWPIIGYYNNWNIIHCIDGIKQHESTNTDINAHIKYNFISHIYLKIEKYTSDNDYGSISAIDKFV